jgi:hypothetical protein
MKAVKAKYANGRITLTDKPPAKGPVQVLVVFPEQDDDPWTSMLAEQRQRSAFAEFAKKCLDDIAKGRAKPLKLDDL